MTENGLRAYVRVAVKTMTQLRVLLPSQPNTVMMVSEFLPVRTSNPRIIRYPSNMPLVFHRPRCVETEPPHLVTVTVREYTLTTPVKILMRTSSADCSVLI